MCTYFQLYLSSKAVSIVQTTVSNILIPWAKNEGNESCNVSRKIIRRFSRGYKLPGQHITTRNGRRKQRGILKYCKISVNSSLSVPHEGWSERKRIPYLDTWTFMTPSQSDLFNDILLSSSIQVRVIFDFAFLVSFDSCIESQIT